MGTAVLDLARLLRLDVVGTASAGKHDLVRSLGGHPIDYRVGGFVEEARRVSPRGFAVVLDGIGGPTLARSHRLVARRGTLVSVGFQSAAPKSSLFAAWWTMARAAWLALDPRHCTRFYVVMPYNRWRPGLLQADMALMLAKLARQEISPVIGPVLTLADIGRAQALLEAGEVKGKLVLRVEA